MSNTHDEKDGITRVNYDEVMMAVATSAIVINTLPLSAPILAIHYAIKALRKNDPTPAENLIKIIEEGKKQGASELEVKMKKSTAAGFDFSVLGGLEGVRVAPEFETETHTTLKIKYK